MLTKRFADTRPDRAGGARRPAARQGDEFKFLDVGGALSGAFANFEVRNLMSSFQFDLCPDAGGVTMVALNDGVFVPEPATWTILFAGMLATPFPTRRCWTCSETRLGRRGDRAACHYGLSDFPNGLSVDRGVKVAIDQLTPRVRNQIQCGPSSWFSSASRWAV